MDLLLPKGTRMLHIGPPKTGTTTLQLAFHHNRPALKRHGVHYAGKGRQPMSAALAAASNKIVPGHPADSLKAWPKLLKEVKSSSADRVVVCSEFFSNADDETARSIVEQLGDDRTHVVITLRPLVKIIPSQWQQYVQDYMRFSYDAWLDAMFNKTGSTKISPNFWRRHRHDQLVERWAAAVGRDNLTVVVLDESDPKMLLRTFEQMLGLPEETLVPHDESANRSLTLGEIEMLRAFNQQFREQGWSREDYNRIARFGSNRFLKEREPGKDEQRLTTPQWAVDRALALTAEMVPNIASSGVRIVGDVSRLESPPALHTVGDLPAEICVPPDAAARQAIGVARSTRGTGSVDAAAATAPALRRTIDDTGTRELVGIVKQRIAGKVGSRLPRRDGAKG